MVAANGAYREAFALQFENLVDNLFASRATIGIVAEEIECVRGSNPQHIMHQGVESIRAAMNVGYGKSSGDHKSIYVLQ